MRIRFQSFKDYLNKLDSKQDSDSKLNDLNLIKEVVNYMKPKLAGEKEIPLLQYGTFFDGEHIFYDDQEVYELDQETFNHAMLNHTLHFIFGSHTNIGFRSSASEYYRDITALLFAHLNISGVVPKYANKVRGRWYEKYHLDRGYGTIFIPHEKTSNYFYEQYEAGKIKLPKGFYVKKLSRFDCVEGIVYIAEMPRMYFTKGTGIQFGYDYAKEKKQVILLKNDDGTFERINHVNKKAKELKEYKEVMDILSGDGDDWDDN